MTTGVRNWPRKPLSERERTIREALERLGSDEHCLFVPSGGGLQAAINSLGTAGGTICLEAGTYTGNITIPTTVGFVRIVGAGFDVTELSGSVLIESSAACIEHLTIRGTDQAYGLKLFKSGAGNSRNEFKHLYIGGTADSSSPPVRDGNGPTGPGVWLDGAILATFEHCTVAYCDGDGLYVNTTTSTFSTNVNTFYDCTFNGNGGYGVKLEVGVGVAGMLGHRFIGGNNENNDDGAASIESAFYTVFQGVDFEGAKDLGTGPLIEAVTATMVIVNECHVSYTDRCDRFFLFQSCTNCRVTNNRISGEFANLDTGVFDESCIQCWAYGNMWHDPDSTVGDVFTPRWVNNRSKMWGFV